MMNAAGAHAGWYSIMPARMKWDNRVAARIAVDMLTYRAATYASQIQCPFLVCVSDKENLMDPKISPRAAKLAPKGKALHCPTDHFEVYHFPMVETIVADQVQFRGKSLGLASPPRNAG